MITKGIVLARLVARPTESMSFVGDWVMDTPEARELLRKLAGGAADAAETQDAKAALRRMNTWP